MPGKGGEKTLRPTDSSSTSAVRSMQSPSMSDQRSPALSIHCLHDLGEHLRGLALLAPHVLEHGLLAVGRDDDDAHGLSLTEAPTAAYGLVVLLVRIRESNEEHVRAVLPVEPPARDRGLGLDHPRLTRRERDEPLLLHVRVI